MSAMNKLTTIIAAGVAAALVSTCAAADPPAPESAELELQRLVVGIENVLPSSWRVTESGIGELPIGWSGPETGLYVMVEDTSTRFFHHSGFHYYSFYRIWLMPPGWEGEMRHTPYVADSAPAFLLGLSDDHVALYHTAGGNVWNDGPAAFCTTLGLDTIRYTDLARRVVDLEIEERLTDTAAATSDVESEPSRHSLAGSFEMNDKDFIGAEPMRKLKERGLPRQLVGLELDGRRIARRQHALEPSTAQVEPPGLLPGVQRQRVQEPVITREHHVVADDLRPRADHSSRVESPLHFPGFDVEGVKRRVVAAEIENPLVVHQRRPQLPPDLLAPEQVSGLGVPLGERRSGRQRQQQGRKNGREGGTSHRDNSSASKTGCKRT